MTEYDFSPEAYQHHLANMHGISKWVDDTEHHRSEFADAAALTARGSMESSHTRGGFQRRPPLHLPPTGHSYSHPFPPYSATSSSSSFEGFVYGNGPRSPGPMPTSMYRQSPFGPRSPPYTSYPHNSSTRSSMFSYGPPSPYFIPPPPPLVPYPAMTPGYIVVPQRESRRRKSSKRTSSKGRFACCKFSLPNFFRLPL